MTLKTPIREIDTNINRTFVRVCFTDIEARDINNTQNPVLPAYAFERNPVKTFRNNLKNYYGEHKTNKS